MPEGTSQTLNSEKIKLVVLAIIELCLPEHISWSVSQSVKYLNSVALVAVKSCNWLEFMQQLVLTCV